MFEALAVFRTVVLGDLYSSILHYDGISVVGEIWNLDLILSIFIFLEGLVISLIFKIGVYI